MDRLLNLEVRVAQLTKDNERLEEENNDLLSRVDGQIDITIRLENELEKLVDQLEKQVKVTEDIIGAVETGSTSLEARLIAKQYRRAVRSGKMIISKARANRGQPLVP